QRRPVTPTVCSRPSPGMGITLIPLLVALFPDPLLGLEQTVGVTGLLWFWCVGGQPRSHWRTGGTSGLEAVLWLAPFEQWFADRRSIFPRFRTRGRRGFEAGREPRAIEL